MGRRSTKVFVHVRENLLTENVDDKNSNNDNGMKYLLVPLHCLSIVETSAVQHVLHF